MRIISLRRQVGSSLSVVSRVEVLDSVTSLFATWFQNGTVTAVVALVECEI